MYPTKFSCPKKSITTAIFITAFLTRLNINCAYAQSTPAANLNFTLQRIYTGSTAKTFTIRGSHLKEAVTISANPPFSISKDSIVYNATLTYDTTELASNQTVYVKFKPTAIGNYADSIVTTSAGADSKIIALTGSIVPRYQNDYNRLDANNIITPNGDGHNDTWVIKNIDRYPNNSVKVMNKGGTVIYSKQGYTNDWGGTYNNGPLAQGTYYYVVDFGEGLDLVYRGFFTIVRD